MIVDFTSKQKEEILQRMLGKSITYPHFNSYINGRSVKLTITGISRAADDNSLELSYDILFEDKAVVKYKNVNGETFFDENIDEIRYALGKDIFWVCSRNGVYPIMMRYDDLKASDEWLICHDYNGLLIFETYSRAMMCWYEKDESKSW